ncbi:hypothetical protein ABIC08_002563 [Bradyrhizobium sp. RT9b]
MVGPNGDPPNECTDRRTGRNVEQHRANAERFPNKITSAAGIPLSRQTRIKISGKTNKTKVMIPPRFSSRPRYGRDRIIAMTGNAANVVAAVKHPRNQPFTTRGQVSQAMTSPHRIASNALRSVSCLNTKPRLSALFGSTR